MPKRIVLFLLGVVLAVGAFLLYQFFSGASTGSIKKPKATLSTNPATLPMTIEERDAEGRLIYFITAPRAPEPIKDAAGNSLPGQFRILSPVARLYDDSGRVVQVEADTCDIAVATLPMPAGGIGGAGGLSALTATGKSAIRLDQISGSLYGHARLSLGAKPGGVSKGSKDPFANGVRIYFDGPVKLDGASQQLTADDAIHIRSDVIEADQQGMKMAFLQKGKKREIQSLRIGENPNGNQIIVRDQGDKAMNLLGNKDKDKPGNLGNAPAVAPDAATKPAESVPVYRLTFGKDVLAKAGDRSLTAQGMSVIFSPTKELMGQDTTKPAPDAAAPALPSAFPLNATMPGLETIPLDVSPIQPARTQDLVITWAGPLEMLPADPNEVKLAAPDEVILDAVGTAEKPVTIRKDAGPKESGFEALAGRLKFQTRQPTVLLPEAYGKVVLRGVTVANAAGTLGRWNEVTCGQTILTIEKERILAQLMGPGVLTDRQTEKGVQTTSVARWKTIMDLVLVPDPNDPKGNNFAIRSAKFDGAQITRDGSKAFDFNADTLDVLLANVKGMSSPQIDHILAMGKVNIDRHGTRAEDQGGIAADRLEIQTQKGAANAAPVLSALNADGNVKAWRYTEKNRTLGIAAASAPASAPALPAGVAGYTREAVSADKLFAALSLKEKSAIPAATAPGSGFVDLGDNIEVSRFVAQRNVRLEVTPPSASATPPLLALADAIDAYPLKKSALITGGSKPDGSPNVVHVTHGKDQMDGQRIEIDGYKDSHDNDSYNIHVPGPGSFATMMPASKTRPQPTPLNIAWVDGMNYDGTNHMIVFTGKPVARSPGKFEDQGFLACDKTITIKLRNKNASATQPAGASEKFDPELEWLQAVGNVDARGAMYDANDKLLSRVRLSAPDSLKYIADGEMIDIPGKGFMVVEDNRPEKAGSQYSTAGETDFVWNGSLERDAKGLITITKDVDFIFRPTKPFKAIAGLGGQNTPANTAPSKPTYVHLHTDHMVATPKPKDPNAKKADNPINIGAEGIATVDVTQGAKLDIGTYTLLNKEWNPAAVYLITGQTMNVDVPNNLAIITGSTEEPANLEQLGTGQGGSARQITIDMTKDKGGVTAQNVIGNFTLNSK